MNDFRPLILDDTPTLPRCQISVYLTLRDYQQKHAVEPKQLLRGNCTELLQGIRICDRAQRKHNKNPEHRARGDH